MEVKILQPGQEDLLEHIAPEVFDNPINPQLASQFLRDEHHHIAVALDGKTVVGFASGVSYLHPDKPLELFINEVGVASTHRQQGIGKQVVRALLEHGRKLGCQQAWVLTEQHNTPALRLYESLGGEKAEAVLYAFSLEQGTTNHPISLKKAFRK